MDFVGFNKMKTMKENNIQSDENSDDDLEIDDIDLDDE